MCCRHSTVNGMAWLGIGLRWTPGWLFSPEKPTEMGFNFLLHDSADRAWQCRDEPSVGEQVLHVPPVFGLATIRL
uniref:Uncharacterized protein n=1 Tax=Manihot esculenta TaxID=3983 RepID=A0A2C9VZ95_MANES